MVHLRSQKLQRQNGKRYPLLTESTTRKPARTEKSDSIYERVPTVEYAGYTRCQAHTEGQPTGTVRGRNAARLESN